MLTDWISAISKPVSQYVGFFVYLFWLLLLFVWLFLSSKFMLVDISVLLFPTEGYLEISATVNQIGCGNMLIHHYCYHLFNYKLSWFWPLSAAVSQAVPGYSLGDSSGGAHWTWDWGIQVQGEGNLKYFNTDSQAPYKTSYWHWYFFISYKVFREVQACLCFGQIICSFYPSDLRSF